MVFERQRCETPSVPGLHIATVRDAEGLGHFQRLAFESFGYPLEIAPLALTPELLALPHAESTLTFDEGYPPLAPSPGNERLLALYDQASRDVGAGPVGAVNPDRAGAADVSFAAGHVRMVLDGIGLMGHSDHTPQETADLSTLPSQTKRAALLLHRIGQGAAGL